MCASLDSKAAKQRKAKIFAVHGRSMFPSANYTGQTQTKRQAAAFYHTTSKPSDQKMTVHCAYTAPLSQLVVPQACPEIFCFRACSMCITKSRADIHICWRLSPKELLLSESHLRTVHVVCCQCIQVTSQVRVDSCPLTFIYT